MKVSQPLISGWLILNGLEFVVTKDHPIANINTKR